MMMVIMVSNLMVRRRKRRRRRSGLMMRMKTLAVAQQTVPLDPAAHAAAAAAYDPSLFLFFFIFLTVFLQATITFLKKISTSSSGASAKACRPGICRARPRNSPRPGTLTVSVLSPQVVVLFTRACFRLDQ